MNGLAECSYDVWGRILPSARTRTGLCMCKNKVSFHTKNNLSFVLLENTQYFTEHVKNPKVAQNWAYVKIVQNLARGGRDHKNEPRVPYKHFQPSLRYWAWKLEAWHTGIHIGVVGNSWVQFRWHHSFHKHYQCKFPLWVHSPTGYYIIISGLTRDS